MKIIITFILSAVVLFAHNTGYAHNEGDNLKAKILEKVLSQVTINKDKRLWSDNKHLLGMLKKNNILATSYNCESSTLIILEDADNLPDTCYNKPIFVLKYNLLSDLFQSFGALFWKKGRPNIVIIKPRTESQSIKISKDLEEYLEERIW